MTGKKAPIDKCPPREATYTTIANALHLMMILQTCIGSEHISYASTGYVGVLLKKEHLLKIVLTKLVLPGDVGTR